MCACVCVPLVLVAAQVCAYCWAVKMKLWPHKDVKSVQNKVATDQEVNKKFFDYRVWLIAQYTSGNKAARGTFQTQQQVNVVDETAMLAKDKGKAMLLSSYEKKHGDPASNGHQTTTTKWKDGSIQTVVLIPLLPDDEMDVEFVQKSGVRHVKTLDDGQLSASSNQQGNLYAEICDEVGASKLKGKAMPRALPAGLVVEPKSEQPPSHTSSGQGEKQAAGEEDQGDSEEEEDESCAGANLMGMLSRCLAPPKPASVVQVSPDKLASKTRSKGAASSCAPLASSGGGGGGGGSNPAGALSSMPAPLGRGGAAGGKRGAKATKAKTGTDVAAAMVSRGQTAACSSKAKLAKDVQHLLSKGSDYTSQWEKCDKTVLTTEKDKAYFKNLTNLSNSMQAKLDGDVDIGFLDQKLTQELRSSIKQLGILVSITKAYKQWVRKPDDAAYLAERARLDSFAAQSPEVSLTVPDCISLDEIEISFASGLAQHLEDGNEKSVESHWGKLSLENLERILKVDESAERQGKIIENTCIGILSGKLVAQDVLATKVKQVLTMFGPVTQTCRFKVICCQC